MKTWRIREGYVGALAPGESITIGELVEEPMPEEKTAAEKPQLTNEQLDKISAELEKTEQALALPNKQIGDAIVSAAKTAHDQERRNKVINEVKRLMQCSDESKAAIDLYTKSLAWYEKKLKAIKAGEFEFTLKGEIFPHDEDLRRANY